MSKIRIASTQDDSDDTRHEDAELHRGFGWIVSLWGGLLPFLRPYRIAFAVAGLLICVEQALEAAQRSAMGFILDHAILQDREDMLPRLLMLLLLAVIVTAAAGLGREWLYSKLCAAIPGEARTRIFERIQMFPLGRLRKATQGDLVTRITVDASSIEPALWSLEYVTMAVAGTMFSLGLLVMTDWRLTLAGSVLLPLALIGPRFLSSRAARESYLARNSLGRLATFCHENLTNQMVLRVFGLESAARKKFARHNGHIIEASRRYNLFGYYTHRLPIIVLELIQLVILGVGGWMTMTKRLTPGQMVTFYLLFREMCHHIWDLMSSAPSLIEASAGMQRITEVLNEPFPATLATGSEHFRGLGEGLRFEDVSFSYDEGSYDDGRHHLDRASLFVPRGQMTAFVGPSGSGKSTALLLLLGLQNPHAGSIRVGDRDLRELSLADYRAHVSVVFQDSLLFHASIRDNILAGRANATEAEIINAARGADIADWIDTLPEGYDTLVAVDTCSGGQRQRLALARALVRDPALLALDEPVSALDAATGAAVMHTLRQVAGGRTVVLVTHQLRDAAEASHICVFDHGRVVETGSHTELLARQGLYATLWSKQNN